MKILFFLQHLSEVVHIPHTKMQKYTDILIICILQQGAMGMLLYLNSQEEQIILDHDSHTDHSQLKPE